MGLGKTSKCRIKVLMFPIDIKEILDMAIKNNSEKICLQKQTIC